MKEITMSDQRNFLSDDSGAVTVDWVVLTAALVGLGLAVMGVVRGGVEDITNDIDGELMRDDIIQVAFESATSGALSAEQVAEHRDTARSLTSNSDLSDTYRDKLIDAESSAAALAEWEGQYTAQTDAEGVTVGYSDGTTSYTTEQYAGMRDPYATAASASAQTAAIYADEANTRGVSWDSTASTENGTGAFQ